MKAEYSKIIKEIKRHNDLEYNLPAYGNAYIDSVYEYNMIRLVLNYYTLKEVFDEGGTILNDEPLIDALEQIHTIIFETLMSDDGQDRCPDCLDRIDTIRNELTDRMTVLTSYTDALQIYEYVLNRIEYGITKETYDVDVADLTERIFRYIFNDNDKMVINSKIQMITAQLPVRMTKNKFFDYVNATLNIYKGSDKSSVDGFVDMVMSTSVINKPKGYGELYPEIFKLIDLLDNTDFKNINMDVYRSIMEQFSMTSSFLTDMVSNHLILMEIVNALYSILLSIPYQNNKSEVVNTVSSMIGSLHDAFISGGDIPEDVDLKFEKIEGVQEYLSEDIIQYESILNSVVEESGDEISWIMADEIFSRLDKISKLMSNSLFVDLNENNVDADIADDSYIQNKYADLIVAFSDYFKEHPKEVNRAVMGSVFSNMPVLFNSVQEIKDYIEHSLNSCSNESELMACAKIIDEMMDE